MPASNPGGLPPSNPPGSTTPANAARVRLDALGRLPNGLATAPARIANGPLAGFGDHFERPTTIPPQYGYAHYEPSSSTSWISPYSGELDDSDLGQSAPRQGDAARESDAADRHGYPRPYQGTTTLTPPRRFDYETPSLRRSEANEIYYSSDTTRSFRRSSRHNDQTHASRRRRRQDQG